MPPLRIRSLNQQGPAATGDYVLYWMIASRRTRSNFALQRAVELANAHGVSLLVLEPLRCDYRWSSPRLHRFVLDGMLDNLARFEAAKVRYFPYVEPAPGAGRGLLESLASRAVCAVTDDFPCFGLPRWTAAAAARLKVRLEAVDSNGLLPMHAAERIHPTALSFRRFLQRELPAHLDALPDPDPLARLERRAPARLPTAAAAWKPVSRSALQPGATLLDRLPLDASVAPVEIRGGASAAADALELFLDSRLEHYETARMHPSAEGTSGLSAYLHFGHVSVHEIFRALALREAWSSEALAPTVNGRRSGWWGMSANAEAFLDELVTWRELGFNFCAKGGAYDRYESLPEWARATLETHAGDERPWLYELDQLERADTHDPLWNAAQRQLLREGRMHGYLRMLWGKKILEWSPTPLDALEAMIELNNKYALDGRDPNSYSGIFWTLGRYDRPWGPERPIFGKVRYMSSRNTARKLQVRPYLERYGADQPQLPFAASGA